MQIKYEMFLHANTCHDQRWVLEGKISWKNRCSQTSSQLDFLHGNVDGNAICCYVIGTQYNIVPQRAIQAAPVDHFKKVVALAAPSPRIEQIIQEKKTIYKTHLDTQLIHLEAMVPEATLMPRLS